MLRLANNKSGVNLNSSFNVGNATSYDESDEPIPHGASEAALASAEGGEQALDKKLYKQFWQLQAAFCNPAILGAGSDWLQFQQLLKGVPSELSRQFVRNIKGSELEKAEAAPVQPVEPEAKRESDEQGDSEAEEVAEDNEPKENSGVRLRCRKSGRLCPRCSRTLMPPLIGTPCRKSEVLSPDTHMELRRLHKEVNELYETLEAKDRDLQLSATIGQNLLQENQDLSERYEQALQQHAQAMEELQQEVYAARQESKNQSHDREMALHLENENSALRDRVDALEIQCRALDKELQGTKRSSRIDLERFEEQVQSLQSEKGQFERKIAQQLTIIEDLQNQAVARANAADLDQELATCQRQLTDMEREVASLQLERCDLQSALQQNMTDNANLRQRVVELHETNGRLQVQNGGLRDAAEDMQATMASLQTELAQYKSTNGNMGSGLDLFSEVEEKRIRLEEALARHRSRVVTQQKQIERIEQDRRSLRAHVQRLMQMHGSKADSAKMHRLENALSQRESEMLELRRVVKRLQDTNHQYTSRAKELLQSVKQGDHRVVVEFMQEELENVREENARLERELQTATMKTVNESYKLHECQAQLHDAERKLEAARAEAMQHRLKLEEMRTTLANLEQDETPQRPQAEKRAANSAPHAFSDAATNATPTPQVEAVHAGEAHEGPESPSLVRSPNGIKAALDFSTLMQTASSNMNTPERLPSPGLSMGSAFRPSGNASALASLQRLRAGATRGRDSSEAEANSTLGPMQSDDDVSAMTTPPTPGVVEVQEGADGSVKGAVALRSASDRVRTRTRRTAPAAVQAPAMAEAPASTRTKIKISQPVAAEQDGPSECATQ
ncbi:uncharacterized protein MONBRDRAFT_36003 [Monosiga brevicollis MX1]|uniref:Uncharacterized protein n=1 Tax=Monosiga brevicollis TaxID=81824 RepID=A9UR98_MONBE|nr:uncharacterized protein MONBRDRAFT_36003 [Monosiga brevicollis MX1]EDQ92205.1 predicted protein [Monosiga brevicollis MX1]|eukprot:XP_001743491.1 hypothetical protein [Monosiga brevicollis MX1]